MIKNADKQLHPNIKDSRVKTYLNQRNAVPYHNTPEETLLLNLWHTKYTIAKGEYERQNANSTQVAIWRDAYKGTFYQLDSEGKPTKTLMKPFRKVAFEMVENKVNAFIPAPKMTPRYYPDITTVNATENLIKHELDRMLSENINDEAEHSVLIDSTVWFKVSWNPFDNTYERSGNPLVECCPIDKVFPQPGISNYKHLEYIFEEQTLTVAQCLDLFGREITSPNFNDVIPIVNCYYLTEDRYVGKFTWCDQNQIVLANDAEWGLRKRRRCNICKADVSFDNICPVCGSTSFSYQIVTEERLSEPLKYIENPYRSGSSNDPEQDHTQESPTEEIQEGTILPHYLLRQLPFIPYRRIGVPNSLYGISEVELLLENQDMINKFLNKAERKSAKSKAYVTKLKDTRITDAGEELSYIEIESPAEGSAIQVKQLQADITEEITMSQVLYDNVKSTSGVTNTDQGKADSTASSGYAKQLQMQASAQREKAPSMQRNLAFAGVYELVFKYLLAFTDETRSFVSVLPDGTNREEQWSKYMFLTKNGNGDYYYRDDFAWSVDNATSITQDRSAMWQLIDKDYVNGTLGSEIDPMRALLMFWTMKEQFGYPTAKYAVSFLKDSVSHLPTQVEQALINNPDAVEMALSYIQDKQSGQGLVGQSSSSEGSSGTQGGARDGAGRSNNGVGQAANTEKTNNKNRATETTTSTENDLDSNSVLEGAQQ